MRRSTYKVKTVFVGLTLLLASLMLGNCDDGTTSDGTVLPADFYITLSFATNFRPEAVDRIELTINDATMLLEDSSGEHPDGGITWEVIEHHFHVYVTGEYFELYSVEASQDTYEIDIPFLGGFEEGAFSVTASVLWENLNEELVEIGHGSGQLELPPSGQGATPTVIDVTCRLGWGETCRTGCDVALNYCPDGVDQCPAGNYECIEGCCVPN